MPEDIKPTPAFAVVDAEGKLMRLATTAGVMYQIYKTDAEADAERCDALGESVVPVVIVGAERMAELREIELAYRESAERLLQGFGPKAAEYFERLKGAE